MAGHKHSRWIWFLLITLLFLPEEASGEPVIKAFRIAEGGIRIDGRLDEEGWRKAEPATGFIQREPQNGRRATERTEVRILYDRDNLYIGAILYDSRPDLIIAHEKKRDADLRRDDAFAVLLDTYHDHRNGFFFETNPLGARAEALVFDEGRSVNFDWDGVWWVEARVTPSGWQVEMKIPFSTLRFDPKRLESWGLQIRRIIQRKNEEVYWSPLSLEARMWRVSKAGHLTGLSGLKAGRHLWLKPYILAGLKRIESEGEGIKGIKDMGMDIKYGIRPNLTMDITINTDFAQTEADVKEVNITRFPLFFPEKRDFFLEGSGYFDFGLHARVQPFFSRRIGLAGGKEVPILVGGKLTGKIGRYTLGFMSVETKGASGEPETNYSVLRIKRDILTRSDLGLIFINKEPLDGGFNRTIGGDISLSLMDYLSISSFFIRTITQGEEGNGNASYLAFSWSDPSRYLRASYLDVEGDFDPQVGFVKRKDIREGKFYGEFFFRPEKSRVREYSFLTSLKYIRDHKGELSGKERGVGFTILLHSGDYLDGTYTSEFDRLNSNFEIDTDITIPKGGYTFDYFTLSLSTEESRWLSGSFSITMGEYYNGDRLSYSGSIGIRPVRDLTVSPGFTREEIDLPAGSFKATYLNGRAEYTLSTRSNLNLLIQWNDETDDISTNLRFTYEYRPGSNIYLVYNEERGIGETNQVDYSLLFKVTYLFTL